MNTLVLPVDAAAPQPEMIEQAAAVLRRGGLVAFPTETVYGLGAHALDRAAVAGIFLAKGRPTNNPLIVHVAEMSEVTRIAADFPELAVRLARQFWPGPLTLVLPRGDCIPDLVTAGGSTVAVRVPAHPVAQALLRASGLPVAAPSANRSSQLSPTWPDHVLRSLEGRIDLLLDGGPTRAGIESTVLDLTTSPPRLLRPGPIGVEALRALIGEIGLPVASAAPASAALPSPGMLSRHYAPRTPLECPLEDERRVAELCRAGMRVGWLALGKPSAESAEPRSPDVRMLTLPPDPAAYAAQLYSALHVLDDSGVDRIVVTLPPDTPEWLAVRDRLRRASS
jgi:L-threonylcarbamoyladenylate synthase